MFVLIIVTGFQSRRRQSEREASPLNCRRLFDNPPPPKRPDHDPEYPSRSILHSPPQLLRGEWISFTPTTNGRRHLCMGNGLHPNKRTSRKNQLHCSRKSRPPTNGTRRRPQSQSLRFRNRPKRPQWILKTNSFPRKSLSTTVPKPRTSRCSQTYANTIRLNRPRLLAPSARAITLSRTTLIHNSRLLKITNPGLLILSALPCWSEYGLLPTRNSRQKEASASSTETETYRFPELLPDCRGGILF